MAQVIKVISGPETGEVTAAAGDRLLAVLRQAGWRISAPCGGNGTCGKCRVRIRDEHGERDALACRTVASGVKEITIPAETGGRILTASASQSAAAMIQRD